MAAPIIRLAPKGEVKLKRLLPKPGYPNIDSMSLKNVKSKPLILQQACQTAKTPCIRLEKKIDIRTAPHDKSDLTTLIPVIAKKTKLPHKPKYSIITEAQAVSQSQALVADAELILCPSTTPARHQLAFNTALDNEKIIPGNNARINEVYCTNTSNISNRKTGKIQKEDYCTNIDKEQDADLQRITPIKSGLSHYANSQTDNDPFLSQTLKEDTSRCEQILDTSKIDLVNGKLDDISSLTRQLSLQTEIETFNDNPISSEENIKKEEVIAELTVPISINENDNKMDSLPTIWSAESMQNDDSLMEVNLLPADMVLVNPLLVEGRAMPSQNLTCEASTATSTTPQERESLNTPPHNSDEDMELIEFGLKWSMENEGGDGCLDIANDSTDILSMVINDTIGVDEVSRVCLDSPCTTLNLHDIAPSSPPVDEEKDQELNENADASVPEKKRPGRPRKVQAKRVPKPRGRPVKTNLTRPASLASHHNYSSGGASSYDSSSNDTIAEQRYRRMRDLNNVASQRCRANRKTRQHAVFDEVKHEEERNKELTMQVKVLMEQVKALKRRFINEIANPANGRQMVVRTPSPFDLEQMVTETAERELRI